MADANAQDLYQCRPLKLRSRSTARLAARHVERRTRPKHASAAAAAHARRRRARRQERKLVSLLFVDLVGFTSRSDRADSEDVRDALTLYHAQAKQRIEEHGGTLEKFAGDAVMAVRRTGRVRRRRRAGGAGARRPRPRCPECALKRGTAAVLGAGRDLAPSRQPHGDHPRLRLRPPLHADADRQERRPGAPRGAAGAAERAGRVAAQGTRATPCPGGALRGESWPAGSPRCSTRTTSSAPSRLAT